MSSGGTWIGISEAVAAGLGSILWAEIVRDLRHGLAHAYPKLMPKHMLHHRVFRPDLTVVDPDLYRQAQWHHDVPEAVTMILATGVVWVAGIWLWPPYGWALGLGVLYATVFFLITGIARAKGWLIESDLTHQPGPFSAPPAHWMVNRTYHWRHHFDDPNAYFCGALTLVDRIMGKALSLKGKTIAVTGASGGLGQDLLRCLHHEGAKVIALTSQPHPIRLVFEDQELELETIQWQVGQEDALAEPLASIDILVLNHGINVHADRSPEAIQKSYEVNTFSSWRLLELFLTTVQTNRDIACKEVWVNTSEAEVIPAVSPLYELSKRVLGDLVTLRKLDAPCVIRKLILGPFKSKLNPIGIMSSRWVARQIVQLAKQDHRTIIVTINPLTWILVPWREFWVSLYFRLFSRSRSAESPSKPQTKSVEGSTIG